MKETVGKVLWHSLDKNGKIGEYDMKFGDTVVQRILPEHIEPTVLQEHEHSPQKRDD